MFNCKATFLTNNLFVIPGRDDDLHATTSIIVMERLREGDKVFVSMVISGPHGDSKLESDFSRKIHFTGLRISD